MKVNHFLIKREKYSDNPAEKGDSDEAALFLTYLIINITIPFNPRS
ncbi:hypothetical protein GCM10008934_13720 [Virgibacillus salarius]